MLLWSIVRGILRSPEQVSLFFRHRRAVKGYLAITRGLIAVGAGDLRIARKAADRGGAAVARRSAGAAAHRAIGADGRRPRRRRARLPRHDRARRHQAARPARALHRSAAPRRCRRPRGWSPRKRARQRRRRPGPDRRCSTIAAPPPTGPARSLRSMHMKGALEKADYRRKRAVLLTARALALEEIDRDAARVAVLEAVKLAPDLVPAAALAGRRLAEAGEQRKARKILEKAWAINPHPGYRRGLRQLALRRQRARAAGTYAETRRQGAGPARRRACRGARRARCARVRQSRARRWRPICRRRRGASPP